MSWKSDKKNTAQENPNGIEIGTLISFHRKEREIEGVIDQIRENSVIVKVDVDVQKYLDIENELTVVNHKNYRVLK